MTSLVVVAHPDDEVLGCGGTIAKLTRKGEDVYVAILGEGATSRFTTRDQAPRSGVDALADAARKAAALLGVKEVTMSELPDNRFDGVDLLDIVKIVESLVERWAPDAVYTHHGGDLNIDHTLVHRAVVTATRPWAAPGVDAVYAFEVASATEWSFNQFERSFAPDVFVDITDTLESKLQAMQLYREEIRDFPHPRSLENLEAAAIHWGAAAGVRRAEAFKLIREIRR